MTLVTGVDFVSVPTTDLERAGLISRGRQAQWRPCRLEARPLKEVADWAEDYRRFWDASYDRLDDYLQQLKEKEQ